MSWYPSATRRRIDWLNGLPRGGTRPRFLVFHLSASEAVSQHGYFTGSGKGKAGSHGHTDRSGHSEQYADTAARSAAEYGARDTISWETQGADTDGRWTDEQCEALAHIAADAHRYDGIPLRLATRSDDPEGGIAWHRLGVDGVFPALPSPLAGRAQRGGVLWSGSRGKACPGDARIQQIPAILARAIQIVSTPTQEDDMFTDDDRAKLIRNREDDDKVKAATERNERRLDAIEALVAKIAAKLGVK